MDDVKFAVWLLVEGAGDDRDGLAVAGDDRDGLVVITGGAEDQFVEFNNDAVQL